MKTKIRLVGKKTVETDSIVYLKADANYTEVHLKNGKKIVVSKTLKELEKQFTPFPFFRTHKSFLINMNFVKSYTINGSAKARLNNNVYASISRRKKEAFVDAMKAYDFAAN